MAKRKKPTDPQDAARHRREREENRQEVERLSAQDGVALNLEPRTKRLLSARRLDCFAVLLKDDAHAEARSAVNWLEELIRDASGENAQERRPDFIRASCEGAPGQNVSQRMVDASEVLTTATEALAPRDARMLFDLLKPDEALLTRWRPVVERCTGETNPQAQGAAVRSACSHLLHIRNNIDCLVRERQERRMAA